MSSFRVLVKPSAVEANASVADLVDERGEFLAFDSRHEAEALASSLTAEGSRVRIQTAAPQEPTDADAYLLTDPERHTRRPKASSTRGTTFDVGANQYGALGEALVVGGPGASPPIRHFLVEEAGVVDPDSHRLRGVDAPDLPGDVDHTVSWQPDYLVEVRERRSGDLVEQYVCEIKSGDASFERGQRAGMRRVARTVPVLNVRLDLDGLPEEYTARITLVEPDG